MSSVYNSRRGRLLCTGWNDAVSIINFVLALARRRSLRRCLRHGTLHHHLSPPPPSSPSSITLRLHSIDVRRAIFHGATHLRSSYHRYHGYRPRLPRPPFALMLDKGEVTASCSASSLAPTPLVLCRSVCDNDDALMLSCSHPSYTQISFLSRDI